MPPALCATLPKPGLTTMAAMERLRMVRTQVAPTAAITPKCPSASPPTIATASSPNVVGHMSATVYVDMKPFCSANFYCSMKCIKSTIQKISNLTIHSQRSHIEWAAKTKTNKNTNANHQQNATAKSKGPTTNRIYNPSLSNSFFKSMTA